MEAREIELMAGTFLSDGGISLPLHTSIRKRPFRVTMKTPTLRSLLRISGMYLKMGVTPQEYDGYDLDGRMRFVYLHGKDISRTVAYGIVRGPLAGRLMNRPVAWLLRSLMTPDELSAAWRQVLNCISTTSFGIIIASTAAMNKMQPMMTSRPEGEDGQRS